MPRDASGPGVRLQQLQMLLSAGFTFGLLTAGLTQVTAPTPQ